MALTTSPNMGDTAGVTLSNFQESGQSKWYVVIITSTRWGDVQAWLPDSIQLAMKSSWGPIVGNIESALGNWLAPGLLSPLGNVSSFFSKKLTAQEWRGNEPLALQMELHFFAMEDASIEVIEPMKRLIKMSLPKEIPNTIFGVQPPGPVPSGFKIPTDINGIPIPIIGGKTIGGAGKADEDRINVYIGNFAVLREVFIDSLPIIEFKGKLSTDGLPMEAVVQIIFKTVYAPVAQDIDIYFPNTAGGLPDRPDISAPPPTNANSGPSSN